jgi:alkanesulfonate monooxygenase
MPVEFVGIAATSDGSEISARSGASFDKDYTLRLARAHEENGWDRVLFAYGSGSPDPNAAAKAAGRDDVPKIQVAFRPIIAPTEEKAGEKAHDIVGRIEDRVAAGGGALSRRRPLKNPENTGSQRLIAIAAEGERFDRALWTRTAAATGGAGNSNALVGTPEVVAQAILDYIDLGVDIISMRGYDLLADAVDVGRHVIPIVREEVAKRDLAAAGTARTAV